MDRTVLAVAIGGFLGACSRYGIKSLELHIGKFPMGILLINWVGAFCLAFFLELTLDRFPLSRTVRSGVSTGFLGAFTTFSALCQEATDLIQTSPLMGYGYLLASALGGILAALAGLQVARVWGAGKVGDQG